MRLLSSTRVSVNWAGNPRHNENVARKHNWALFILGMWAAGGRRVQ